MRHRLLRRGLPPLLVVLGACAESPVGVDPEREASVQPVEQLDAGAPESIDAGEHLAAEPHHDSGPEIDGASPGAPDAALPDANSPAALMPGLDAGREPAASDSGTDSGPRGCTSSELMCNGACVDPRTNPAHCGGCGTSCGASDMCSQAKCALKPMVRGCTSKRFEQREYLLCTEQKSWSDARKTCLDARMDLAVVDSRAENDFLRAQADSWIAPNDIAKEGEWRLPQLGNAMVTSGAPFRFERWASLEPNNFARCDGINIVVGCLGGQPVDEDCALLREDGSWIDLECALTYRFICEAH